MAADLDIDRIGDRERFDHKVEIAARAITSRNAQSQTKRKLRKYAQRAVLALERLESAEGKMHRELLDEIADAACHPVFEDERVKYVEIQIDRDTWEQLKVMKRPDPEV